MTCFPKRSVFSASLIYTSVLPLPVTPCIRYVPGVPASRSLPTVSTIFSCSLLRERISFFSISETEGFLYSEEDSRYAAPLFTTELTVEGETLSFCVIHCEGILSLSIRALKSLSLAACPFLLASDANCAPTHQQ